MKVLASQLTEAQTKGLRAEVAGRWSISSHGRLRAEEKGITKEQLTGALQTGSLIEFHNERQTRRILLRATEGTCIVLDLDTRTLVTAYHNDPRDRHSTLRRNEYYWGQVPDKVLGRN